MSNHLFEYDNSYTPPAPIAQVELIGIGTQGQRLQVTALLDSGADGTMSQEISCVESERVYKRWHKCEVLAAFNKLSSCSI